MMTPPDDDEPLDYKRLADEHLRRHVGANGALTQPHEPPPTPPKDDPTPPTAVTVKWCPQCAEEAPVTAQFCGRCALSLRCPRCQRDYAVGHRFCANCGLDPARYGRFLEHVEAGSHLFDQARQPGNPSDRLQLTAQAARALEQARELFPDDQQGRTLAAEVQRLSTSLLWELCAASQRAGELSRAMLLLERLALEPSEEPRARARMQELLAERARWLANAGSEAVRGKWDRAVQMLLDLQKQFPEDAEIANLLVQYQQKAVVVDDLLTQRVPALREARQITALLQLLTTLQQQELNLAWLPGAIDTCQKRLTKADELLVAAEWHHNAGRLPESLAEVERALELVADHERALQLRHVLGRRIQEGLHCQSLLERAVAEQRWFRAERLLERVGNTNDPVTPRIRAGVARADHFLRFVVWTLLGALALFLAARMAAGVQTEVVRWLPDPLFDVEYLSHTVLQSTLQVTVLAAFAYLLLAFLLACFRQPLTLAVVVRDVVLLLLVTGASSLLWAVWTQHIVADPRSFSERCLRAGSWMCLAVVLGGLLGYIATSLASRLIPLPPGLLSPLHVHAVWAGVVSVILCGESAYVPVLLFDAPAAVICFGLLGLVGVANRRNFYLLVLAAVISSGIRAMLTTPANPGPGDWLGGIVAWGMLAGASYIISSERRWLTDAVCAGTLAGIALLLHSLLANDVATTALTSSWLFVCGVLAQQRFPAIDHRLHLLDRLRGWTSR